MKFSPAFVQRLPGTHALLKDAHLTIHPAVERIVLHGSRGPSGGSRPNSDLDLSLVVNLPAQLLSTGLEPFLQTVLETTLNAWHSDVELDLAVVFETRACALHCFTQTNWQEGICSIGGLDCFGLYKIQKGFTGFVKDAGIEVSRMYPCMEIWRHPSMKTTNHANGQE